VCNKGATLNVARQFLSVAIQHQYSCSPDKPIDVVDQIELQGNAMTTSISENNERKERCCENSIVASLTGNYKDNIDVIAVQKQI